MASLRENASIMRAPYSPLTSAARSSSGGDAFTPRVPVSRDAWPAELSSSSRHRDRERDRERAASSAASTCCTRSRMIMLATLSLVLWLSVSLWWCLQGCASLDSTNGGGVALTHTLLNGNNNKNQLQVPACTPQPCETQECPACPTASAGQATAPSSAESEAERRAEQARVVSMQNVLPFASTPGDSTGSMLILHADDARTDAFIYEMCSFTRVCAAPDALYLFVQKREEYDRLAAMFEQCVGPKDKRYQAPEGHYSPCHCFYPQMAPRLLPFFVPEDQPLPGSSADTGTSLPDFSAPSFLSQTRHDPLRDLRAGHTFLLHKFVRIHHIAHWAQKVVFMQSMMRHAQRYFPRGDEGDAIQMATYTPEPPHTRSSSPWTGGSLLEPWAGMAMIDMDLPLTPHESFIFNASLRSILEANPNQVLKQYLDAGSTEGLHPVPGTFTYAQELDELWERYKTFSEQESAALLQLQQYSLPGAGTDRARQADAQAKLAALPAVAPPLRCFERLSWNRNFGVVSSRAGDTAAFRRAAYASIGADLSRQLERRCPPRKVVLLYRSNRVILNWAEVVSLVKELTGYTAERMTIDGNSSPEEQVRLFASAGLLISSHSSQLINVLFSHPSSALIEASSEFFNADFAEYAHGVGVFFRYALGGVVEDAVQPVDPGIQACTDELSHCEGSSYCILIHRAHCPPRHDKNKKKNFHANLTALRVAVTHAKNHLNWACDGLWSKYEF